jgi:acetyl esterase/lipase
MSGIHPDLSSARFTPNFSFGPVTSRLVRGLRPKPVTPEPGVSVREISVPGPDGAPEVTLRVFSPEHLAAPVPAMLWIHGGGHVIGNPEQNDEVNIAFVRELGIVVAAVRYRLGAELPAPASVEDAYAGLRGLVARAEELQIDPAKIAIGGASAGGGIAAALALLAHDRGEVRPAFQLLVYPMLDDRTVVRTDHDTSQARGWTAKSNRYGWATYLGQAPGSAGVSPYAAPARREDLAGLPPAWIGVGDLDLFYDENIEYARRLRDADVPCELQIVEGAFHGFDAVYPKKDVSVRFWKEQARALRLALFTSAGNDND